MTASWLENYKIEQKKNINFKLIIKSVIFSGDPYVLFLLYFIIFKPPCSHSKSSQHDNDLLNLAIVW